MSASPAEGAANPVIILSVVVLPAPFAPRNPVIRPGLAWNEILSIMLLLPYRFDKPRMEILPRREFSVMLEGPRFVCFAMGAETRITSIVRVIRGL